MSALPQAAMDVIHDIDALRFVIEETSAFWAPEVAPLTVAMANIGQGVVQAADSLTTSEFVAIFQRIESLLLCGTSEEKNAAASGFLEALAAALDIHSKHRWILGYAGNAAVQYLTEWNLFCGVASD